jgi:hypothetical protein
MTDGAMYWSVVSKLHGTVAFDTRPCNESTLRSANTKPGAIHCFLGHNHIYVSRDFHL